MKQSKRYTATLAEGGRTYTGNGHVKRIAFRRARTQGASTFALLALLERQYADEALARGVALTDCAAHLYAALDLPNRCPCTHCRAKGNPHVR